MPRAEVDLIESVERKCAFMRRAAEHSGIGNARVICDRAETWATGEGREAYPAVTARAVGRLATLAELASPLLAADGVLVAWKGRRDPEEEAEAARAEADTAMRPETMLEVTPFPESRNRHLHVLRKCGSDTSEPAAAARCRQAAALRGESGRSVALIWRTLMRNRS